MITNVTPAVMTAVSYVQKNLAKRDSLSQGTQEWALADSALAYSLIDLRWALKVAGTPEHSIQQLEATLLMG